MNTRTTAIIAGILVIALVAAGAGYAYNAWTTTTTNTLTEESIEVIPKDSAGNEKYTGGSAAVKYDTMHHGSSTVTYGISADAELFECKTIFLKNNGSSAKQVTSIIVTMKGTTNSGIFEQLTTGNYKDHSLTATFYSDSGRNTSIGTATVAGATGDNTRSSISFTITFNTPVNVPTTGTDIYFKLGIGADSPPAADATALAHTERLGVAANTEFTLQFKATAEDVPPSP